MEDFTIRLRINILPTICILDFFHEKDCVGSL